MIQGENFFQFPLSGLYQRMMLYARGNQLFLEKGHFWKVKKLEGHICRAESGVFEKKGGPGVLPRKMSINGMQMVQI